MVSPCVSAGFCRRTTLKLSSITSNKFFANKRYNPLRIFSQNLYTLPVYRLQNNDYGRSARPLACQLAALSPLAYLAAVAQPYYLTLSKNCKNKIQTREKKWQKSKCYWRSVYCLIMKIKHKRKGDFVIICGSDRFDNVLYLRKGIHTIYIFVDDS